MHRLAQGPENPGQEGKAVGKVKTFNPLPDDKF